MPRPSRLPMVAAATMILLTLGHGAAAQESVQATAPALSRDSRLLEGPAAGAETSSEASATTGLAVAARRPRAMVPLYVSYAALQALDVHSTARAIDRGAVEANPVMRGMDGNRPGMLALKAAGTAGVIYAGEKLWRKNKTAAVVLMVAANSAVAFVVQRNYRIAR